MKGVVLLGREDNIMSKRKHGEEQKRVHMYRTKECIKCMNEIYRAS